MKGIVWLMQKKWYFLTFQQKELPPDDHYLVESLVKDWVQWRVCQNGMTAAGGVVFERAPEERETWAKKIPSSKSMGSYGEWKIAWGAGKGELKSGKMGKRAWINVKGKKQACSKDQQREDILNQHTSPIKKPRDTGENVCMAFWAPGIVWRGSLRSCDFLPPQTPFHFQS